jgi:hypothetical protein
MTAAAAEGTRACPGATPPSCLLERTALEQPNNRPADPEQDQRREQRDRDEDREPAEHRRIVAERRHLRYVEEDRGDGERCQGRDEEPDHRDGFLVTPGRVGRAGRSGALRQH